jgi:hypothetical protein
MKFTRLRAKARRVFRRDRGATDPILVIAAIAVSLVLLVGGSFAVAGMIANGKNTNAKGDLDKIATAETAAQAGGSTYLNYTLVAGSAATGDNGTNGKLLDAQDIGFNVSDGENVKVAANTAGWIAAVKSTTGNIYYRTSTSSKIYDVAPTGAAIPAGLTVPAP